MTNTESKDFKVALEAKRMELIGQLCGRAAELNIGAAESDLIDRIQSMTDRDQTASMLNRLSSTLAEIDRSLREMSEGCYGICAGCEKPIALKRLQSIPWAQYCVRCQEELEVAQDSYGAFEFDQQEAA